MNSLHIVARGRKKVGQKCPIDNIATLEKWNKIVPRDLFRAI